MSSLQAAVVGWAESGRIPDPFVRIGMRRLLGKRSTILRRRDCESRQTVIENFIDECVRQPVALVPQAANEQHYEVPAEFFHISLGPRRKYSCCEWTDDTRTLAEAEELALLTTADRAQLGDGQRILELGCGWGSLSLWMAEKFPHARITAVSNSNSQREFIQHQAENAGFRNLTVDTADMNTFDPGERFDRVVSIEMFEHMRNHRELLRRISSWLLPDGKLFVHIFCHRDQPYLFEDESPADWMTRHFFSGGMMPSDDLFLRYQEHLVVSRQWRWNGRHYQKTCEAWLANLDRHHDRALRILAGAYGPSAARLWLQRWRMFFMACAELFGYRDGNEWWVTHLLFERPTERISESG